MTNIKDLLEAELDYKTGTIKVKDIGKVDVKIENRELGIVNSASPGRESNYRTVGSNWRSGREELI